MKDWNVVATVREGHFEAGRRLLEQYGQTEKTTFFNVLVLRMTDPLALHGILEEQARIDPGALQPLARVIPVSRTFSFQSPEEFETKACHTVQEWYPRLADATFHVRMHRRGFKGKLSSMNEELFLDRHLQQELDRNGRSSKISFDDPDLIIAVETVGTQAGLSIWTRDDLRRYPLLHLD